MLVSHMLCLQGMEIVQTMNSDPGLAVGGSLLNSMGQILF